MKRFVVDTDTLLRIAAGEIEVASDRDLARAVSGLVEIATIDALRRARRDRSLPLPLSGPPGGLPQARGRAP